jgi:hypothetical protein
VLLCLSALAKYIPYRLQNNSNENGFIAMGHAQFQWSCWFAAIAWEAVCRPSMLSAGPPDRASLDLSLADLPGKTVKISSTVSTLMRTLNLLRLGIITSGPTSCQLKSLKPKNTVGFSLQFRRNNSENNRNSDRHWTVTIQWTVNWCRPYPWRIHPHRLGVINDRNGNKWVGSVSQGSNSYRNPQVAIQFTAAESMCAHVNQPFKVW